MKRSRCIISILCVLLVPLGIQAQTAEFETAAEAVKNMKVGWNLWNTLESNAGLASVYDPENYQSLETQWGHPKTKPELMKMFRKAGFNAIRVPVTWFPYMDEDGNVDSRWMQRVHEVVDYVIDQGMYCMLNVHHDTGDHEAAWLKADEDNYKKNHKRFENLWRQIAEEFKDYNHLLLFESYNEMVDIWGSWGPAYSFSEWSETKPGVWEPTGHDEAIERSIYNALNNYAQSFVDAVRSTGGNNIFRNLVVNTYCGSYRAINQLEVPFEDNKGHIAFQVHYYPNVNDLSEEEVFSDIEYWEKELQTKEVPLIIGEWCIWGGNELTTDGLRLQGEGFTITSVVLIPSESRDKEPNEEIILWEGEMVFDNLAVNLPIEGALFADAKVGDIIRVYYKKDDATSFNPMFKHSYSADWSDFQNLIDIQETYFQAPITESVMADVLDKNMPLLRKFLEKTKADGITIFSFGGMSGGYMRNLPAFEKPEDARLILKCYYGDLYEPTLPTEDDYDYQGINVSYNYGLAELSILRGIHYLCNYKGIRVEVENADDIIVKMYGESEDKEQFCWMSSNSETFTFEKSALGSMIRGITLQNAKDGKNKIKILKACLIRNDGKEEVINNSNYSVFHGCEYEMIMPRKQFVHTVGYDYQWAELNIFYDDIPLKLKNYKGIRLELADEPKDVHIKVYGDGEQKEDYIGIEAASTTILFNTDIFSNEINRVTLQFNKDGKGEVKVISAWLIRQDGTEEYSALSPFHGCEIKSKTAYVTAIEPVAEMSQSVLNPSCHRGVYNLNGQRLSQPQKGINVINGKKVVIR